MISLKAYSFSNLSLSHCYVTSNDIKASYSPHLLVGDDNIKSDYTFNDG